MLKDQCLNRANPFKEMSITYIDMHVHTQQLTRAADLLNEYIYVTRERLYFNYEKYSM